MSLVEIWGFCRKPTGRFIREYSQISTQGGEGPPELS